MRREQPKAALVGAGEPAGALVEHFEHAGRGARHVDDRHAEQVSRGEASAGIDRRAEAAVGADVGDGDHAVLREAGTRDPRIARDPDLVDPAARGRPRPELARCRVVYEQRRALAIEQVRRGRDDPLQKPVEIELDDDALGGLEQLLIPRPLAALQVVGARPAERGRGLVGNRLEQGEIDLVETPVPLVQHFEDADRLPVVVAQWDAYD